MNIIAALDLETTGLNPATCEVLEIALVPLNMDFTISTTIPGIEKITPLGHNLAFDMSFMKAAFPEFSKIFSHQGRDSMRLAYILNDVLRVHGGEEMFTSGSLKSVKAVLDIEGDVRHHALEDARDAAHAYRKMIAMLEMA